MILKPIGKEVLFMKKITAVLLAVWMVLSLTGCSQQAAINESSSSVPESSSTQEVRPPAVADAALYRGTVTEVLDSQLTVEQYDGRDYGESVIVFTLPQEDPGSWQEGDYVEIYYGEIRETAPAQADAISVYKVADQAETVVTNGTVKEVATAEDGEISGVLINDSNGQDVFFHIGTDTQIYMNQDDLQEGKEISVLHTGVFTRSLPPQGNALEISPWRYQRQAEDSQVTE